MTEWDDPKNNGRFFEPPSGPERHFKIVKGIFTGKVGVFVRQEGDIVTLQVDSTAGPFKIDQIQEC